MSFREIDPDQAAQEIKDNPQLQLLDVRETWEYEKSHIEGVKLIPLGELPGRHSEVEADKPVLCICAGGVRSERAAKFLLANGFSEVINMSEGMKGWEARGLPSQS